MRERLRGSPGSPGMAPRPTRPAPPVAVPRAGAARSASPSESGQALLLLVAILCAVLAGAIILGKLARAFGARGEQQRAADLGALAGARAMRELHPRLFVPAVVDGVPNPQHIERAAYLEAGRRAATVVARANGAEAVQVSYPHADPIAPVVIRVAVGAPMTLRAGAAQRTVDVEGQADAELTPQAAAAPAASGDEYAGPLAYRQGKPMRPDVAQAFDRMAAAAAADGVTLSIASAYRSNAEQAVLFARHPDPKWVAPPGKSLHRLGTELDLGPPAAYAWLAHNAPRFHFVQRYSWEAWHFGFTLNAGSSAALAARRSGGGDGAGGSALPAFVPAQYTTPITRASQRWSVSATLLAAQLYQESHFNPYARSAAGALGIAQFMPGTARDYVLRNPFDPVEAIDRQAHLMRDLLRQFGDVRLALAAYNAGPVRVRACGCVPPIPETLAYVASILGLAGGAGETTASGLAVRLVR
jgi:soluble lytic murein transglycosylase-like protein